MKYFKSSKFKKYPYAEFREMRLTFYVFVLALLFSIWFAQTSWYCKPRAGGVIIAKEHTGYWVTLRIVEDGQEVQQKRWIKKVIGPLEVNQVLWTIWAKAEEENVPDRFFSTNREVLINYGKILSQGQACPAWLDNLVFGIILPKGSACFVWVNGLICDLIDLIKQRFRGKVVRTTRSTFAPFTKSRNLYILKSQNPASLGDNRVLDDFSSIKYSETILFIKFHCLYREKLS